MPLNDIGVDETWSDIVNHEGYWISSYGRVYSSRSEAFLAPSRTMQGDLKVSLYNSGERTTRALRVLVAEAFVDYPYEQGIDGLADCDTVIVKDGNKNHIHASNLEWRPGWFAQMYARQFPVEYDEFFFGRAVIDENTGLLYPTVVQAGLETGQLFKDIQNSTISGKPVFPSFHVFSLYHV